MSFHTIDGGHGLLPDLCVEVDVTNDPTNVTRVWTDITTLIRQLSFSRSGRSDELQRTTPGTFSALCDNRNDAVTGLGIRKAQWVRVRAQYAGVTYARWQGIFESLPRKWPSAGKDATIELQAADVLKVFRFFDMAGQTFGAQRNDQRVSAVCALAGVPSGSIDTDTDAADAVVTPMSEGADALSTLLDIEASENGLLIGDPAGTASFQGRHYRILHSGASVAVIGDAFGIPYRDTATLEDDDTRIVNTVAVTTADGATTQTASDATSQNRYWKRRLNRTLLTSNASVAADAANYLLNRYKDPTARIPTLDIPLAAVPAVLKPTLLAANNSTRFTWTRTATTPISEDVYVEQISETIVPGTGWNIGLQLSPSGDESGWVLGDAVLGVLDSTTRLVY